MTSFTAIDGSAAAVRARILANKATLGDIKVIKDRDEDPAVIADNVKDLPMVCVIPLGDKPDQITFSMGSNDWMHEFDLNIIGYYHFSLDNKDPFVDLATVRQYSFDTLELFRGATKAGFYPTCNAKGATIEIGYNMTTDYVIYRYDIRLHCMMLEGV
jgi:hypothetical protein